MDGNLHRRSAATSSLRTLIVEDELISQKILRACLEPLGMCDIVMNGQEALAAFSNALRSRDRYHLVCLDITLPGMDGHAVLKGIRDRERVAGVSPPDRVKVIMTSASESRQGIARAFCSECDAYMIKPIGKSALLWKLASLGLHE